jgi:hypothetical protein
MIIVVSDANIFIDIWFGFCSLNFGNGSALFFDPLQFNTHTVFKCQYFTSIPQVPHKIW